MKITEAKITFTADIASYCMEEVVNKGKLLDYFVEALRQSSDREYSFVFSNMALRTEGEVEVTI